MLTKTAFQKYNENSNTILNNFFLFGYIIKCNLFI